MSAHDRVYRTLLRLYPREHRERFGHDMEQLFSDRLRDEGGGVRTLLLWTDIASDLATTVAIERMEVTIMRNLKQDWWVLAAPVLAAIAVFLGFGNMVTDDGGPFWQRALAFAVTVAMASVVVVGVALRRRGRALGSLLVGLAVLPGSVLIVFFWFPPVALVGILCAATGIRGIIDYDRRRRVAHQVTI